MKLKKTKNILVTGPVFTKERRIEALNKCKKLLDARNLGLALLENMALAMPENREQVQALWDMRFGDVEWGILLGKFAGLILSDMYSYEPPTQLDSPTATEWYAKIKKAELAFNASYEFGKEINLIHHRYPPSQQELEKE